MSEIDAKPLAPIKPVVQTDLLDQLDIRVGTIEAVADVLGSKKLVELRVSFGDHVRKILVGMKGERANVHEIEGRQAQFVINLPRAKWPGEYLKACCWTSDMLMD